MRLDDILTDEQTVTPAFENSESFKVVERRLIDKNWSADFIMAVDNKSRHA